MLKLWVLYILYVDSDYEQGVRTVYDELPSVDHLMAAYNMTEEKAKELLLDQSCDADNETDSGPCSYHFVSVNYVKS